MFELDLSAVDCSIRVISCSATIQQYSHSAFGFNNNNCDFVDPSSSSLSSSVNMLLYYIFVFHDIM